MPREQFSSCLRIAYWRDGNGHSAYTIVTTVVMTIKNMTNAPRASVRPMSRFGSATFRRNSSAVSGNSSAAEFEPRTNSYREFQRRASAAFHPFMTRMIAAIITIEDGTQIT